jgi:TRAP-type C4-dicarboxylate transport system permease small subunit
MQALARVGAAAQRFAHALAAVAVLGLLLLALATTVDVVLRYGFASPIRGFADVVGLAGAVLLSACMPYVVASRGNISIDFLGRALGPRAHRALNLLGALASFALFAVMAWQYVAYAAELRATGDTTPVLRWPVWPWWSGVAVFIAVTAVVALLTLAAQPEGDPA